MEMTESIALPQKERSQLKRNLRRPVLRLATIPFALVGKGGFLANMGWFRTLKEGQCVDKNGSPIPWWSYSFIVFLEPRLSRTMKVFEYGSGHSTLWLARRVGSIVSMEISRHWYELIKKTLPVNAKIELRENYVKGDDYALLAGSRSAKFDIVVVDGRDRARCAMNAIDALTTEGVIIWDDADQPQMREGREFLKGKGFRQLSFVGTGPQHHGAHSTCVFYRDGNCLGI